MFAAVASQRSFSAAGELLNLSTAAVSLQIKTLETYLQVRLLVRDSQRVELSAEGERLLPFVERGLAELEHGFRLVRAERSSGVLVVSMLTSFLHSWLTPRLAEFLSIHPEIDLRLQCTTALTDFARSEVHVAIRMGRGGWTNVHSEKLYEEWLAPVCAPSLFEKHRALAGPGSTGSYPLLHSTSEPWEIWTHGLEYRSWAEHWPARGAAFDDSVAVLGAAAQGQGLVLGRWSLLAPLLASGQLVLASDCAVSYGRDCWFVCPPGYLEMAKVQVFREWLFEQARRMPGPSKVVSAV